MYQTIWRVGLEKPLRPLLHFPASLHFCFLIKILKYFSFAKLLEKEKPAKLEWSKLFLA